MAPEQAGPQRRLRRGLRTGTALVLVLAGVPAVGAWLLISWFGKLPVPLFLLVFLPLDLLAALVLTTILLIMQRRNLRAAFIAAAVPISILAASSAKVLVLGASAQFGDVLLLGDLFNALPLAWGVPILAAGVAIGAALLLNLRRWAIVALAGILVAGAVHPPGLSAAVTSLAARIAPLLPHRLADFPSRGHVLAAVTVAVEELEWTQPGTAAPGVLPALSLPAAPDPKRNLHIIVLESFADPRSLPRFSWSSEPFTPLFARWREEAPGTSLAPVFGNRSSNTEFEVLCGQPSLPSHSAMVFARFRRGTELGCLPRLLRRQGYRTISLVPSSRGFFWAGRAFAVAGFERSVFDDTLDMEDRDGFWLSAESTLRQARASWAALGDDAPRFTYVFVNASHYPYERNRARRPDRVAADPPDATVEAWANAIHHAAAAVEEHVALVLRDDPDAVFAILGDHNPPLGPGFAGYVAGGRLEPNQEPAPLTRAVMYETPLLVLDRGRLVETGALPAWQIPHLLLDLLSRGASCAAGQPCPHRDDLRLRPLPDIILLVDRAGREAARCPWRPETEDQACAEVRAVADAMRRQLIVMLSSAPQTRH